MIVTISGTAGSGKSTVGKLLAKKTGCKFYSAGDVRGKYAIKNGITLEELNRQAEKDPKSDKLIDEYLKNIGEQEDNIVIDARLGFFFIPHSIKVFLDADENIRAERIFSENRLDEKFARLSDAKKSIIMRQRSDEKRYQNLYSVNPFDKSHYDLVIDTSNVKIDEVVGQVYRFVMFNSNPAARKK